MRLVIISILLAKAFAQCDFEQYNNVRLTGPIEGSISSFEDAKKSCLLNRPRCNGVTQINGEFKMRTGLIANAVTDSDSTAYFWNCPTGFPYYVLESSNCANEGYDNLNLNSCSTAASNAWIIFLLGDYQSGGVRGANFAGGPKGCILDTLWEQWEFNSNNNQVSASDDYKVVCYAPPTAYPTLSPTDAPTPEPTLHPSPEPTRHPSPEPTRLPTPEPTRDPTPIPTTARPTAYPTKQPSFRPTEAPTLIPTTLSPTDRPTRYPTRLPTRKPTFPPSKSPTRVPTYSPSKSPTRVPTLSPTTPLPTFSPSLDPTQEPTSSPSASPTLAPSTPPTQTPTPHPTQYPTTTRAPTDVPSLAPSPQPTIFPTSSPTSATDIEYCFTALMEGREYDLVVDDGLNEAMGIFGVYAEIHVMKGEAFCNQLTGQCEMQYCIIVDDDHAEIFEDKISTDPSDIEEAWEAHLEEYDGSASDTVEIQINYSGQFSSLPGDTFFGNFPILAAIAFGGGVLCGSFVCIFLRIKNSEMRFLSDVEKLSIEDNQYPEIEMPEVNEHQPNFISGDEDILTPSNIISDPGSFQNPQDAQPGSRIDPPGQAMSNSVIELKAMEMPLPAAEGEDERKGRPRGESRFEGQTEVQPSKMQRPAAYGTTNSRGEF